MIWSRCIAIVLIATSSCIDAAEGSKPGTKSASKICSPDYNCRLNSKTRRKIQSFLDDIDNGVSFDHCKEKCMKIFKGKKEDKCECYCAMFHKPCPSDTPETEEYQCQETLAKTCIEEKRTRFTPLIKTGTLQRLNDINVYSEDCEDQCLEEITRKTKKTKKTNKKCSCFCFYHQVCRSNQTTDIPETEDYQCQETLDETCIREKKTGFTPLIKTRTLQRLQKINVYSEDCEDQCLEEFNHKTRMTNKKCSCFCFYHQVCRSKQTSEPPTITTTITGTTTIELPLTTTVTAETTTTTSAPSTTTVIITDAATTTQPTTEQPTTDDTTTIIEPPLTMPEPTTTTAVLPQTTDIMMPTPTPMPTDMLTTTEMTTTEATTTEATTTEATTTEAITTTEATTTEATTTEATTTEGVTTPDPMMLGELGAAGGA